MTITYTHSYMRACMYTHKQTNPLVSALLEIFSVKERKGTIHVKLKLLKGTNLKTLRVLGQLSAKSGRVIKLLRNMEKKYNKWMGKCYVQKFAYVLLQ